MKRPDHYKYRISLLMFLILLVPLGIGAKIYEGPGSHLVSNKLAGVFYVIFWIALSKVIWINSSVKRIAIIILLVTSILEITQLFHSAPLEFIRGSFVGRSLIGSSFSYSDFIYYIAGAILACLIIPKLNSLHPEKGEGKKNKADYFK